MIRKSASKANELEERKGQTLAPHSATKNPLQPYLTVTESTIIATIHCPDVGFCLFRNPLVAHIPYHVPSLLLYFPIGYYLP